MFSFKKIGSWCTLFESPYYLIWITLFELCIRKINLGLFDSNNFDAWFKLYIMFTHLKNSMVYLIWTIMVHDSNHIRISTSWKFPWTWRTIWITHLNHTPKKFFAILDLNQHGAWFESFKIFTSRKLPYACDFNHLLTWFKKIVYNKSRRFMTKFHIT